VGVLASTLLLGLAAAPALAAEPKSRFRNPVVTTTRSPGKPLVIGHRGNPAAAPEETLPSFQSAIDRGADVLELDVQWTVDGQMVALHDTGAHALDRTTDCTGSVQSKTLEQIRTCDAGSWKGSQWKGTRVPTFDEVAALAARARVAIAPEMKEATVTASQARQLAEAIEDHGLASRAVVQSFHPEALRLFRDSSPAIPLMYVTRKSTKTATQVRAAGATYYASDYQSVTATQVRGLQRAGISVWLYAAGSSASSNAAIARPRPNGIMTNDVDATKDYLAS
jgi:glycerophosphoryl diester phosphodiesterase